MRITVIQQFLRLSRFPRYFSSESSKSASPTANTGSSVKSNVTGLSSNVLSVPTNEVGPGASKSGKYKNPEYFCYNTTSFFEAEIEMLKYRCPQPSALKK
uniref:Uncharacterized protein n=1 Tax=Clastoptera arizonana TaxID=38151 RepID=A0A1B6E9G1_9HEMI